MKLTISSSRRKDLWLVEGAGQTVQFSGPFAESEARAYAAWRGDGPEPADLVKEFPELRGASNPLLVGPGDLL